MLAAALVPDTALLHAGAAGRTDVLVEARAAAGDAVAGLVAARPRRVVVVAPDGPAPFAPPGRPSWGALGIPDPAGPDRPAEPTGAARADGPLAGPTTSVALDLLEHAGWRGEVVAVGTDRVRRESVTGPGPGTVPGAAPGTGSGTGSALAALGRAVATDDAVLLTGSLSARRGPDAPLPQDPRAASFDEAVLTDLVDLGPGARARLAAVPDESARDLVVTAWGSWQVLVGAVDALGGTRRVTGSLRHVSAPFGCTYVVCTWAVR